MTERRISLAKRIYRRFKGLSSREDDLHQAFRSNYYHFKLLLYANRKALEVMAEIEGALRGTQPFGINAVRAWSTQASANVLQIIKSLDHLAPGKYRKLYDRFDDIRKQVSALLSAAGACSEGPLVRSLDEVDKGKADEVGSKMALLGEMKRNGGLPAVPLPGFVITARGYQRFMEHNDLQAEIYRRIQASASDRLDALYRLSTSIQLLIGYGAQVPEDLKEAILSHYDRLQAEAGAPIAVAVRSSAIGEDFLGVTFAGQYHSELNVRRESLLQAYKNVVASKYSLQAMSYRLHRGIRDEDVAMCVGVVAMVDAVAGGVAYSRNPVNIRDDSIVIHSVWGLPKSVVEGTTATDRFVVSRKDGLAIVGKEVAFKDRETIRSQQEGTVLADLAPQRAETPSLTDEQALKVARLAVELEALAGNPQDLEWAVDGGGSLVLLQCRPLQQVETSEARRGESCRGKPETAILRGGVTASPGVAAGPVCIVRNDVDAMQFPKEAVLVVRQSLPRWAALLSRASAVVTEQGSSVGHLATVAREFGVPALFGLPGALEGLKNGQRVTVDADARSVHEGLLDSLCTEAGQPKKLMEGSPVMTTLRAVADFIVPLYLIDPDGSQFKAQSCKTYHDITRFCHEKVLEEMFRFGKERRLVGRSSKQLKCDLPMTYWLLNLDDGFSEEVEGNVVELKDIASIPMLAFWRGMMSAPWGGAPAVAGRGLMSAFLQATMNPRLDPALRSPYATRNYCLIAKHFCILQLRFNFHFCTLESLVGEADMNNYIIYHFKGGAANLERREFRARLVAEVLDAYDFRTHFKEDAAFARLEGHDQAFVEKRLEIAGYLTMHTRQLDLAMTNANAFNHHKKKILNGIETSVLSHGPRQAQERQVPERSLEVTGL